jgi:paraquat-inducible protein B
MININKIKSLLIIVFMISCDSISHGLKLKIEINDQVNIIVNAPINYNCIQIGEVTKINSVDEYSLITVKIFEKYKHLVNMNSRFYVDEANMTDSLAFQYINITPLQSGSKKVEGHTFTGYSSYLKLQISETQKVLKNIGNQF